MTMLDPKGAETLAEEFGRLVREYREPDTDGTQTEAWNLIADFAVENADVITRSLSIGTPAEVGGRADAQTEARAIARCVRGCATDDQYIELVERIATALAAKDAELAAVHQRYVDANEARIDAEAAVAEARKALGALCDAYAACNGEDHPAYRAARRALTGGKS